jgi:thioredoxin reductase
VSSPSDVAIVGGGPAGLQAALVLARTRKRVVVFDRPAPPRNGASHGVHNFLGLDGFLPAEIRDRAWAQIDVYGSAQRQQSTVRSIRREGASADFALETDEGAWTARHVLLTCGYEDVLPAIDGFLECWGHTIVPCPFCDGYENRDRVWGIVATMPPHLDVFPSMVLNWTESRMVIVDRGLDVSSAQEAALLAAEVPLHRGPITELSHQDGELVAAGLSSGETIALGTLLWTPPERPTELVKRLVDDLGLALGDDGYVAADDMQRTNIDRLWAAGDVQGWAGAIEAATAGGTAAHMIVKGWFEGR